ncbi:MAG TPA: NADH-quinone oxidoreductase subunit K [Candidatus Acidoferrum sp.]|nr:NADH-quinone oxidoreductase subunit K [Candidatus Acidoferrum sp.]
MTYLPYCIAAWLFVVGLYGIVTSRHFVHLIICLSVVQSSTYLLLLSIGFRSLPAQAPIFSDVPPGSPAVDPIVHALTLTDIVVGATVTALLLALTLNIKRKRGSVDPAVLSPFPE